MPADAAVLMDFVNTVDERSFTTRGVAHVGGDELDTVAAATRWLRDRALLRRRKPLNGLERGRLLEFRQALRDALAARAGHVTRAAITDANSLLATLPLIVQLDPDGGPYLVAGTADVTAGLGEALARTVTDGRVHRLRMCAAPDCRWVFYDTSRNGGGRWCSMAVCGNRDKTRRYRERRASG